MSCCEGESTPAIVPTQAQIDALMAGLPRVVVASSDPYHPLASSIRNSMPTGPGPTIHDDGSIEFAVTEGADPPQDINGYTRDPANPWLFRAQWSECQLRMAGVRKVGGSVDIRMVCNNPQVTTFQKFVTAEQCSACPAKTGARKNPA